MATRALETHKGTVRDGGPLGVGRVTVYTALQRQHISYSWQRLEVFTHETYVVARQTPQLLLRLHGHLVSHSGCDRVSTTAAKRGNSQSRPSNSYGRGHLLEEEEKLGKWSNQTSSFKTEHSFLDSEWFKLK